MAKAENGQGYNLMTLLTKGKERRQSVMSRDMYDWDRVCTRSRPGLCVLNWRPCVQVCDGLMTVTQAEKSHGYTVMAVKSAERRARSVHSASCPQTCATGRTFARMEPQSLVS